ncbi:MAG: nucleoside deaminase [Flavobacteriales bacterium]|nr:nucleoside deaminase [Flavobacteriales bacterium]
MCNHDSFMNQAVELSALALTNPTGGPFGAIIVKNGEVIGKGNNSVSTNNDPTAHAEVMAIRDACKNLNTFQLDDCILYTSCEPCPMCFGAIYWSRLSKVYYACTKKDASDTGFDDDFIYRELNLEHTKRKIPMIALDKEKAIEIFQKWKEKQDKIDY